MIFTHGFVADPNDEINAVDAAALREDLPEQLALVEAAAVLGVELGQLQTAIAAGTIKVATNDRGAIVVPRAEIVRLLGLDEAAP